MVWATRAYLLGLMGHAVFEVVARSFYAQQNARTPVITSAVRFAIYVLAAILLFKPLGPVGIGLADTLAITSEALLLLYLLNRGYPGVYRMGSTLIRIVIGSLLGGLLVVAFIRFLPFHPLIASLVGCAVGGLVVLPIIWPELKGLVKL